MSDEIDVMETWRKDPDGNVEGPIVTLASAADAYNFRAGDPIQLSMSADGSVRLSTRWERLRANVGSKLSRWTRWFRPRTVVACVDTQLGTIGLRQESWSWRHWRWE